MALTKSASELGSIPTPDASFLNITDTICDKNITKKIELGQEILITFYIVIVDTTNQFLYELATTKNTINHISSKRITTIEKIPLQKSTILSLNQSLIKYDLY